MLGHEPKQAAQQAQREPEPTSGETASPGFKLPAGYCDYYGIEAELAQAGLTVRSGGEGEESAEGEDEMKETAALGTRGTGSELPHLTAIRHAFGHHDVSGAQAFTGGDAALAARSLGASAFAHGDKVGFDGTPDLHTAAHEAAHVVQQRSGSVSGEGDAHEAHADQVADQVVRGESAESLLDHYQPGTPRKAVQRKLTYQTKKGPRTLTRKSDEQAREQLFKRLGITDKKIRNHLNRLIDSPVGHTLVDLGELGFTQQPPSGRGQRGGLIKDDLQGKQRLDEWFRESVFDKQQHGFDKHLQLIDRLIADLEKLPPDEHHRLLAEQLPGVLLYLMHNSSHAPPRGLSKVQVREFQAPLFYARSQDDHPHKDLLLEIVRMVTGKPNVEVGNFLLPCNEFMKSLIDETVDGTMSLSRDTNYEKTQEGLVKRPGGKTGLKYDGTVVGNAGLRKNNAQTITDSLAVLLRQGGKTQGKSKDLQDHGLSEKKLGGTSALIQLLRVHYELFGKVPSKVAEPKTLDEEVEKLGKPEPKKLDEKKLEGNTLFGRNLAYRSSMAAAIAKSVGSLEFLSAVSSDGHPNLSVVIHKPPHTSDLYTPGQSSHAAFVNVALSYFGGLLNALAASMSIDVCVTRRQSFGFSRPTLTDTGASFRLSLGMQPDDYAHVVIAALHHLDIAIGSLDSTVAKQAFQIIEPKKDNGAGDRLCHFMSSETNQLKAFQLCQGKLSSFSDFVSWIASEDEKKYEGQKSDIEGAHFQEGVTNIVTDGVTGMRIGKSVIAFENIKDQDPALKLQPMRDALAAVVAQAHETLWSRRKQFGGCLLPETLKWLITRLLNGIHKGRHLLANWRVGDVEEESRLFSKATIVVEDLLEHMLALRSLPMGQNQEGQRAEERVKILLCGLNQLDSDLVHVYRADSGEQAGVASMLLTAKLSLEGVEKLSRDSKIGIKQSKNKPYFEYPKAIKETGLMWNDSTKSKSIGEIGDLSPYGGDMVEKQTENQKQDSPDIPDVLFVDITNVDLFGARVGQLIQFWKTLPKGKRLVLFSSLLKHEELGLDKLQAGRIIVFGEELPGLQKLDQSVRHPVVDDFLNMMLDINLHPVGQ